MRKCRKYKNKRSCFKYTKSRNRACSPCGDKIIIEDNESTRSGGRGLRSSLRGGNCRTSRSGGAGGNRMGW